MLDYRIEAKLQESPDLHQLAQLFITMALECTKASQHHQFGSGRNPDGRVES